MLLLAENYLEQSGFELENTRHYIDSCVSFFISVLKYNPLHYLKLQY